MRQPPVHHIYYHCTRQKNWNCKEPYISEGKLIRELLRFIQFTTMAHPQTIKYTGDLNKYMNEYERAREITLLSQDIDPDHVTFGLYEYAQFALRNGSNQEKIEIVRSVSEGLFIKNKFIASFSS